LKEHKPTDNLIKLASAIDDPVKRRQVTRDILELRAKYAGTEAEFKAPDGQPSGLISVLGTELGQQAWYAVRTPAFKNWFGDWERTARIKAFEDSQNVPLSGNAYQGKYELNKESIFMFLKNTLSKTTMHNSAINEEIRLGGAGIDKLIGWGMKNDAYKKLFAHIPEITEKAVFLAEENPNRPHTHYNKYSHLAGGIQLDGDPYTVHIILGESGGQWYYSHILLHIEKGSLLNGIRQSTPGHPKIASLTYIKDTTLLRLLQADSSKIIDEHGEPRPFFHGTNKNFDTFMTTNMWGYGGAHFSSNKNTAAAFAQDKTIYDVFINIRNPLILDAANKFYDSIQRPKEIPGKGPVDTFECAMFARNNKYDGVVINNLIEHGGAGTDVIAFDPSQIKSVSSNIGTFNRDDPSFIDAEITKIQKQGNNPLLLKRDINIKENSMSDLSEDLAEEKNLSPKELAFQNTVYHRNMIAAALKKGTCPCLPGKDGYADTTPAINLDNHNFYRGETLLYLKNHQKENGFPTAEYLTQAQIEKANKDAPNLSGIYVIKGQKGVSIHQDEWNDETGKWDTKHMRLFNVAQLKSPKNFNKWLDDKRLEYFQSQHGTKIQPPEPGQKAKGPEIVCESSDPVKYLGQYFAAVSTGRPFKASKETAQEFSKNMGDRLYAKTGVSPKTGEPVTDPFSLSKLCREANKYCKEFKNELRQEQKQEQKQEQSQKRGSRKL